MKIKNILYRRVDDLTPTEKQFYIKHQESGSNPVLNECDKSKTIHHSEELFWSDQHDLKGNYQALSKEAYEEVGATSLDND